MHLTKKRGQSTLEYAILILVIIAALISIQAYIKRGVQGRLKSATDDIGDQFSPGNTNSIVAEKTKSKTHQLFGQDETGTVKQGVAKTILVTPELTNTVTQSTIVNDQKENWGG
jgi:uncharacterized protein (UPF0333 family)